MSATNGNGATAATTHASLAEALVAAQAEMPAVEPDATNPHFKSKFVSLGHLIAKARPVLNRHGIAVMQFPSFDEAGKPTLVTVLIHGTSKEREEHAAPLLLSKNDAQGHGSAITYMRRYALAAALGISDQEDDDGNASTQQAQAKPATVDILRADGIGSLIYEAMQREDFNSGALSTLFTGAGVTAEKIDAATVKALTADQADVIERELREVIA